MITLGIETSCDETGVAIFCSKKGLLGNVLYSQVGLHAAFGGVVPELASRDHVRKLLPLVKKCLTMTNLNDGAIDAIAYTKGPGLIGALLVGAGFATSLAWAWKIPVLGVHHMEGHLLSPMLEAEKPNFPFVALLVSGGHTLLILVKKIGDYRLLGETVDDAVGEAFDKTAKLLGLPYPGGKALAELAEKGEPSHWKFPRPMIDRPGMDFSFSGLKTAVMQAFSKKTNHNDKTNADIAYAFQEAVVDTLAIKTLRAIRHTGVHRLVVGGGVSANQRLRQRLKKEADEHSVEIFFPRPEFCTDNGAMIAYAGCQRLMRGEKDGLGIEVKPRWSLLDCNYLCHY